MIVVGWHRMRTDVFNNHIGHAAVEMNFTSGLYYFIPNAGDYSGKHIGANVRMRINQNLGKCTIGIKDLQNAPDIASLLGSAIEFPI